MSRRGPLEDLFRARAHRSEPMVFRWAKWLARNAILTAVCLVLAALLGLLFNIPLMLLIGVVHANIDHDVIAAGYGATYPIAWILSWFVLNGGIALQAIIKD